MRPALVPVKNIKIEVPKKRREEAELLAAGHAAGAVELGGTCKTCTTASACPLEHDTAQEGFEPTSSGAADPLPSPSPSVPLHDNQGNGADFSMDLDPVLPPPGLVDISSQPDRGLPTFNIDDGLIQPRVIAHAISSHCVSNLLLTSVLTGPKEQIPDELQRF